MPKKKNSTEATPEDSALVSAAKTLGSAAGKIASAIGVKPETPAQPKAVKRGKPQKQNKPHLPRRMKKQLKKEAAKKSQTVS